jgi:hypothetical protein
MFSGFLALVTSRAGAMALGAILLGAVSFGAGWQVNGWRKDAVCAEAQRLQADKISTLTLAIEKQNAAGQLVASQAEMIARVNEANQATIKQLAAQSEQRIKRVLSSKPSNCGDVVKSGWEVRQHD